MKTKNTPMLQFYVQDEHGNWACWINLMSTAIGVYTAFQLYTDKPYRRKGYATKLMKDLIAWADKHKVILHLGVKPWGEQGLNTEELYQWYINLGFKFLKNHLGEQWLEYRGGK